MAVNNFLPAWREKFADGGVRERLVVAAIIDKLGHNELLLLVGDATATAALAH